MNTANFMIHTAAFHSIFVASQSLYL